MHGFGSESRQDGTVLVGQRDLRSRMEPLRPTTGDLVAGLSVFLVLIPQGLAYAKLAGMPIELGLVAGVLPPIIAAFFVSSPYLQTGPTALTALLVFGALSPMAVSGSTEYVAMGALLALLVGVLRVAFGLFRLGIAAYFVSQPVLTGFTTGAAVLITGSQVPTLVGVPGSGDSVMARAFDALAQPGQWNTTSLILGLVTLALTIGLRRVHPLVPSVLIAVGAVWLLAAVAGFDVESIGDIPSVGPSLSLDLPWGDVGVLLVPAIVIALVGFVEPASIARTYASAKRERWSANQEFVSQGVANLAAGLSGAFPVGGSFGRSSLNERAGAQTRWSGLITGVAMLAFLPFAGALETLPRTALAAVVVSAAVGLIRLDRIRSMWAWSKPQSATAVATLVATLALDPRIDRAILFGIALSVGVHLWREIQVWVSIEQLEADTLRLAPHGVLWFGSVNRILESILTSVADHPEVTTLVIDLEGVGRLDLTAAGDLADFVDDQRDAGLSVDVVNIPPHAERIFAMLSEKRG